MSKRAEPARRPRSIAWSILALVVGAVGVAAIMLFAVTFSGPPPMDPPRPLEEVARTLAAGQRPSVPGPALKLSTTAAVPLPRSGELADSVATGRLAALLGRQINDVRVFTNDQGRYPGHDVIVGSATFACRERNGWQVARTPPRPLFTPWHRATMTAMLVALIILAVPAWFLARAMSRPLRELVAAAESARGGAPLPALPTSGPTEVRALSHAIGDMHARLAQHSEGRTAMLAAIAHDLGTPLARLAFRIEQLPDAARTRALSDIAEMRAMIAAALGFARDEVGELGDTRLDLGSLLDSLVEDMHDAGRAAVVTAGPRAVVRGGSSQLRRLFTNLVENAMRYGKRAEVGWSVTGNVVVVTIDDDGPGVDPDTVERLFEPFVRGDPSRNRATGGTGLGLAIVRTLVARHGGEVTLQNRAGGARAKVTLPLA